MALRTESLFLSVLHNADSAAAAQPLPGLWSFVETLDLVHAQLTDNVVRLVSLDEVKHVLRTRQKTIVPVAVGRVDHTLLWAFVTNRFTQTCEDADLHMCSDRFVMTVQDFLPAVLNSAHVHHVDTTQILKIDVNAYSMMRGTFANMLMCENAVSKYGTLQSEAVLATQIIWVDKVFCVDDLPPPVHDMLAGMQLTDALNVLSLYEVTETTAAPAPDFFDMVATELPPTADIAWDTWNLASPLVSDMINLPPLDFQPLPELEHVLPVFEPLPLLEPVLESLPVLEPVLEQPPVLGPLPILEPGLEQTSVLESVPHEPQAPKPRRIREAPLVIQELELGSGLPHGQVDAPPFEEERFVFQPAVKPVVKKSYKQSKLRFLIL